MEEENTNHSGTIDKETLLRVQQRVLEIYKEIKHICDENDIRYYAVAGTAIGAIRHSGFIPWDDDIDIGMPRKDFDRFRQLSDRLPLEIRFSDYGTSQESPIVFGKAVDQRSCYTNSSDFNIPAAYYGVFVDVMPMDGSPDGKIAYKVHRTKLRILLTLHNLIIQHEYKTSTGHYVKRLVRTAVGLAAKLGVLNKLTLKKMFIKAVRRYDFDQSEYTASYWQFVNAAGMRATKRYPVSIYSSQIDMPFEDTTMRMPVGYEEYFQAVCPDYMTPPPKSKQVPHHSGIIDFNKSYIEYAKEVRDSKG